jgi:hypothetical protein
LRLTPTALCLMSSQSLTARPVTVPTEMQRHITVPTAAKSMRTQAKQQVQQQLIMVPTEAKSMPMQVKQQAHQPPTMEQRKANSMPMLVKLRAPVPHTMEQSKANNRPHAEPQQAQVRLIMAPSKANKQLPVVLQQDTQQVVDSAVAASAAGDSADLAAADSDAAAKVRDKITEV